MIDSNSVNADLAELVMATIPTMDGWAGAVVEWTAENAEGVLYFNVKREGHPDKVMNVARSELLAHRKPFMLTDLLRWRLGMRR